MTLSTNNGQCENIFHKKCLGNGAVCFVIIDSVSYANIITLGMVEQLKDPIVEYTTSYNLQRV